MGRATVRLQQRMTSVGGLQGRRIVVTRAREQAGELVRALEARGAEAVLAPVIRIQPLENLGALRAALTGLSAYRWVVFTSQNSVHIVFDRLVAWGLTPHVFATTSDAAIGSVDAVTFTSSSTARYCLDLVCRDAAISGHSVAATIGPIMGATARELGLRDVIEAEPHTVPCLVASLVRRFA